MSLTTAKHQGTAVILAIAFASIPAAAQRTTFNPSFEVSRGYTNNVTYSGGSQVPDDFTTLAVILPVVKRTANGSLDFRYRPSFVRHDRFEQLDRDEHRLRFDFTKATSRLSRFGLRTSYVSSQLQGDASSLDDSDLIVYRRTNRDVALAGLGYESSRLKGWTWNLGLDGAIRRYEPVSDDEPPVPERRLEDRNELIGSLGFARNLSPRTSVGFVVSQAWFVLEVSGEELSTQLAATYDHRIGRHDSLRLALGGYYNTGDAAGTDPDEPRTGGVVGVRWAHSFRRISLRLYLDHRPSAGGALTGTALQSVLGLAVSSSGRQWLWGVYPRLARREPANPNELTRTSAALSGEVSRRFSDKLSLRLRSDFLNQYFTGEDEEDRSTFSVYLGLIWSPVGGTRLGGA
jgi:hypothetical protein